MRHLPKFRGDLDWIHRWEGHAGKPYWPGGASGVTLDAGFDLGYADPALFEEVYTGVLTEAEMSTCRAYLGVRGQTARDGVNQDDRLRSIRISKAEANEVFPYVVESYWLNIADRFEELSLKDTPGAVQTAFLSLSVNRGPGNEALAHLQGPLNANNWDELAGRIEAMQDDHPLEGIQTRRDSEAALIEAAAERRQEKLRKVAKSVRQVELAPTEELPTTTLSEVAQDVQIEEL